MAAASPRPSPAKVRIIFLGPPGAGKGTQAARLAEWLDVPKISTGDMLRDHIARGTEVGREADPTMATGGLVPDPVLIKLIRERISHPDAADGFIFDGFPRTLPQAEALDGLVSGGATEFDVFNMEVPREELLRRLSSRQRGDDTRPMVLKRLQEYDERTRPLVDWFQGRARFHRVDGFRDVNAIQADLRSRLRRTA